MTETPDETLPPTNPGGTEPDELDWTAKDPDATPAPGGDDDEVFDGDLRERLDDAVPDDELEPDEPGTEPPDDVEPDEPAEPEE